MKRKIIVPVTVLTLLAGLVLTGCGGGGNKPGGDSDTSQSEEVKINITAEGNKTTLVVGETVQLAADVDGVTWSSLDESVATVNSTGLVTALAVGPVTIRASKTGYKRGSISITVEKAPARPVNYRLKLEKADHYPGMDDGWGAYFWGTWYTGPFDTPVENNNGATEDGTSVGNLYTGCREVLSFTCDKAVTVGIGMSLAYANEVDLAATLSVKLNDTAIDLTGKVCEAGGENNYYSFNDVEFGNVSLLNGTNVLEIEIIGQSGINMDEVLIYTEETLQLAEIQGSAHILPKISVETPNVVLTVDQTAQIVADQQGVAYASANTEVATVSNSGLITAVAAGNTTISVSKEGFKAASVAVRVNPKPVEGQVVLEAEDAILPEGATIQMETGDNCSGGRSLGYFSAGQTFTLEYNADEAKTVKLLMVASSASLKSDWSGFAEFPLNDEVMTLTLNGEPVSLGNHTLPESQGWTKNWVELDLGNIELQSGKNVFAFEAITQGPNIDCLKLNGAGGQGGEGGEGGESEVPGGDSESEPPVAVPMAITVPNVADVARLEVVNNLPTYIVKATFTGDYDADATYELYDGERVMPLTKVERDEANLELYFNISSLQLGAAQFYPHIRFNGQPWNGEGGNGNVGNYGGPITNGDKEGAIVVNEVKYVITGAYGMPTINVRDGSPAAEGVQITGAAVANEDGKAIVTISGTSTANMSAKKIRVNAQRGDNWQTINFTGETAPVVEVAQDGSWTLKFDVTSLAIPNNNKCYVIHVFINDVGYDGGDGNLNLDLTDEQASSVTIGEKVYEIKQADAPWGQGARITGLVISNAQ